MDIPSCLVDAAGSDRYEPWVSRGSMRREGHSGNRFTAGRVPFLADKHTSRAHRMIQGEAS